MAGADSAGEAGASQAWRSNSEALGRSAGSRAKQRRRKESAAAETCVGSGGCGSWTMR